MATKTLTLSAVGTATLAFSLCNGVSADIVTLEDGNSLVEIDTGSSAGMNDWEVDGVDHLFQQWFWFRVGGGGGEASLDTLTQTGIHISDTNPFSDVRDDTLAVLYSGSGFTVELLYSLRGGNAGDGRSDVTEAIVVRNTGSVPLDFHFFQYSDFDINGTASGDTAQILGGNTAQQFEGNVGLSETVVTPMPSHLQVDTWPNIINSLNDGSPTTLNDNAGPVGPADLSWAFQWDFTLGVDGSYIISKDKSIVPAPGAMALLGLAALAGRRRRRA